MGWSIVELAKFGLSAVNGAPLDAKYTEPLFWTGAVALIVVSGVVAVLNGTDHVTLLHAVQYGINAPAIISGLATTHKRRNANRKLAAPSAPNTERGVGIISRLLSLQAW